jgi:hypothetical protein
MVRISDKEEFRVWESREEFFEKREVYPATIQASGKADTRPGRLARQPRWKLKQRVRMLKVSCVGAVMKDELTRVGNRVCHVFVYTDHSIDVSKQALLVASNAPERLSIFSPVGEPV